MNDTTTTGQTIPAGVIPQEAIMETLSPAVRVDLRPAGTGACMCAPGTNYARCECAWGVMITRALQLAYGRDADDVVRARELKHFGDSWADLASKSRRIALRSIAGYWTMSVGKLAKLLGVTTNALRDFAPEVCRSITDRRGTTRS